MPSKLQLNCLQFYTGAKMPLDPNNIAKETGKAIADIPLWVWVVVSLAGMSGETWRASLEPEIRWQEVARRVLLRTGACAMFGMADALGIDDNRFVTTLRMGEPVKGGAVLVKISREVTA